MQALTSRLALPIAAAMLLLPAAAHANIVLSRVVIDIVPNGDTAQDIDVSNDGDEIAYVVIEPSEIVSPGLPGEKRVSIVDPAVGGLLVSPQRMILQPHEHKLIRVAAVAARGATDRIYRLTVKPVAGPVTAQVTALKLLVGYDALVIYRPNAPVAKLVGQRSGNTLTLRNDGNTNLEVFEGKQCPSAAATGCAELPSRRLYAGQSWTVPLASAGPVTYRVAMGATSSVQRF
jgi:P pilus assembly chaperone PapD